MTHSLSTHGGLTEPSLKTMSGKGREGNKERKGVRRASFASWRLVTYRARFADAMMALTGEVEA